MKARPDQLKQQLASGLAPLYFICGDEPLQVMESSDLVRAEARRQNYMEREVLDVEAGFDWNLLSESANSLSLFAEQRIIELRMGSAKPGKSGAQALIDYAQRPAEDAVLIITAAKPEGATKNSKWFKALDQTGVVVQCWPVAAHELPRWVEQRMRAKDMRPDREAVTLIVDRVEGNLLAATQEIDKLYLLYGEGNVDLQQVTAAVADSARYSIYDLVDSALQGELARTSRIVGSLKNEGVEPVLALWALSRELRLLVNISNASMPVDAAMAKVGVWNSRKTTVRKALSRHSAGRWKSFLKRCARIDKVIKGVEPGRPWDELLALSTQIARP
jgi:DNA polymerase-3 subunit delta